MVHFPVTLLVGGLAIAAAENILINAGNGLATFAPDSIQANVGDTLEFHFFSNLHTVVQGDFDTPCAMGSKKDSGWNSGPFNNTEDGGVRPQCPSPAPFQPRINRANMKLAKCIPSCNQRR